ncbi:arginase-2, mitochondrial-like [Sander lucioperca]|uniref:arginase-2, mitochondrial-like n=1 Tax=Sander lucioperca TaxID=283035 RepID=UPI001653DCF8|nr:arginase-2, mitochondrial-like [Sander lucioperca]
MRSARTLRQLATVSRRSFHLHHHLHQQRSAGIIGAPFSGGQPQGGVERGPDLIRAAGLLHRLQEQGCAVKDYGNLVFEDVVEDAPVGGVKRVRAVGSANRRLSEAVQEVKKDGHTSVMLGGDHRCRRLCWRHMDEAVNLLPGWAMNKQPSKESLKGKVEEIFGLGHPQPPSKQSETRPSEFIITTDIIKEHNWTAEYGIQMRYVHSTETVI